MEFDTVIFFFARITGAIVVRPIAITATSTFISWTSGPEDMNLTSFTILATYVGPCRAINVHEFQEDDVSSKRRTFAITSLQEFSLYNITVKAMSGDSVVFSSSTTINTKMSSKSSTINNNINNNYKMCDLISSFLLHTLV